MAAIASIRLLARARNAPSVTSPAAGLVVIAVSFSSIVGRGRRFELAPEFRLPLSSTRQRLLGCDQAVTKGAVGPESGQDVARAHERVETVHADGRDHFVAMRGGVRAPPVERGEGRSREVDGG